MNRFPIDPYLKPNSKIGKNYAVTLYTSSTHSISVAALQKSFLKYCFTLKGRPQMWHTRKNHNSIRPGSFLLETLNANPHAIRRTLCQNLINWYKRKSGSRWVVEIATSKFGRVEVKCSFFLYDISGVNACLIAVSWIIYKVTKLLIWWSY